MLALSGWGSAQSSEAVSRPQTQKQLGESQSQLVGPLGRGDEEKEKKSISHKSWFCSDGAAAPSEMMTVTKESGRASKILQSQAGLLTS